MYSAIPTAFLFQLALASGSQLYRFAESDAAIAAADMKILRKPGNCESHPAYPETIQCAITNECIAFSQFNNGKCDCCGSSGNCNTCSDKSDENRGTAGPECKNHPLYATNLTFQCAGNKNICLGRVPYMGNPPEYMNGVCDCCPDKDCSKCNDHSDEECMYNEWHDKFYCDGNCLAITLWKNNKQECPTSCIEPDVKAKCLEDQARSAVEGNLWFCSMYVQKNTRHYNCTSETRCLTVESIRDGVRNCKDGEDESTVIHPNCSAVDGLNPDDLCEEGYTMCVAIGKGKLVDCRCPNGNGGVRSCNKRTK